MDPKLLVSLFDRHAAALELYAAQWADAPADIVQEAFIRLVQQDPMPKQFVGWLYRTVRNGAISAARSSSRRRKRETAFVQTARKWFESTAESELDVETATNALQELPEEQREVIVAKIWGRLSFEQIADIASISSSTAHRRYEAGLNTLRERLGISWPTKSSSLKG
ncbi:MAG: sigma-70 family RNA polymerase sigma factor [Planctomycetes bacterium]|nr:sigma-70 family RNA polymerase sigma factor [Planctomycetota bacterium]